MNAYAEPADLFPMPLSSMEHFHWFDSSQQFPNQIYGRLRFEGQIERSAAEQAVQIVVERQAMLGVMIRRQNRRLVWQRQTELPFPIQWHDAGQSATLAPIDLKNEFPWRVNFQTEASNKSSNARTNIWFQASHTVFDGLGATQLISDWLKTYHQLLNPGAKVRSHRLASADLKNRNGLGLLKLSYLKHLWKQPLGCYGAAKFVFRKPAELCSTSGLDEWDYQSQPRVIGTWLDKLASAKLKQRAVDLDVNLNTLLVGELMKLLEDECRKNADRQSRWIRIILPMSIRSIADRRMPAANRATVVQVDRRSSDFERDGFFHSLNREIGIIREWELGKLFLMAVYGMSAIPGMLQKAASSQKCRGTAIFANLGEPFGRLGLPLVRNKVQVGNLLLTDFDFVGPIRNRTPINFSVQKHFDRYRISLHFDPRVLSSNQATEILRKYERALYD